MSDPITRPLRSTTITAASALLRVALRLGRASVMSASRFALVPFPLHRDRRFPQFNMRARIGLALPLCLQGVRRGAAARRQMNATPKVARTSSRNCLLGKTQSQKGRLSPWGCSSSPMARACLSAIFLGPRLGHQRSGLGFLGSKTSSSYSSKEYTIATFNYDETRRESVKTFVKAKLRITVAKALCSAAKGAGSAAAEPSPPDARDTLPATSRAA